MAGLNWNRSGHTWTAERPHESGGTRHYQIEDFPGYGQAHLMVSVDEFPVNTVEHYSGQFGSAEEARAAAEHLDGMHFVDLDGHGSRYEAMDDEQLDYFRREAFRKAVVARRVASQSRRATWGETIAEGLQRADAAPAKGKAKAPKAVRRDDIRLFQPEESGLEYAVLAQHDPEHDSWTILKSFDPPKRR